MAARRVFVNAPELRRTDGAGRTNVLYRTSAARLRNLGEGRRSGAGATRVCGRFRRGGRGPLRPELGGTCSAEQGQRHLLGVARHRGWPPRVEHRLHCSTGRDGDIDLSPRTADNVLLFFYGDVVGARRSLVGKCPQSMWAGRTAGNPPVLENRGNGTFIEATDAHGLGDPAGAYGFGWGHDSTATRVVSSWQKHPSNFLYHNRGTARSRAWGMPAACRHGEGRARRAWAWTPATTMATALDLVLTPFATT